MSIKTMRPVSVSDQELYTLSAFCSSCPGTFPSGGSAHFHQFSLGKEPGTWTVVCTSGHLSWISGHITNTVYMYYCSDKESDVLLTIFFTSLETGWLALYFTTTSYGNNMHLSPMPLKRKTQIKTFPI